MEHRRFRISAARFGVRTTSSRFAGWLDDALDRYRVRGRGDSIYSVIVSEQEDEGWVGRPFHILYRAGTQVVRSLSAPTLGRMLMGELESLLYPRLTDAIYLKAALLFAGERTALLPSPFLTWIGGLGRHVARAGISLPATKFVAVDRSSSEIVPLRGRLEVPEDALDRLSELVPSTGPPDRTVLDRRVAVNVVYNVVSNEHDPVSASSRAYTVQQLAGSMVNARLMGSATLRALAGLVEGAECYQLAFGDPRSMLRAIGRTLLPSG